MDIIRRVRDLSRRLSYAESQNHAQERSIAEIGAFVRKDIDTGDRQFVALPEGTRDRLV